MIDNESLKRDIMAACEEDHVGLWEVIRMVERRTQELDPARIEDYTLSILHDLLSTGQIEAGLPSKNGRDFEAWRAPAAAIVAQIRDEWKPGKRPGIGEVAWFTTSTHARQTT